MLMSDKDIGLINEQLTRSIVLVSLDNGSVKLKFTPVLCLFRMSTSFVLRAISLCMHAPRLISCIFYDLTASNRLHASRLMGYDDICSIQFTNLKYCCVSDCQDNLHPF